MKYQNLKHWLVLSFLISTVSISAEFVPPGATKKITTGSALELPGKNGYIKPPHEDWTWYAMPSTTNGDEFYACTSPAKKMFLVTIRRSELEIRMIALADVVGAVTDSLSSVHGKILSQRIEYIPLPPHETVLHASFQVEVGSVNRSVEQYIFATGSHLILCIDFPAEDQERKDFQNFAAEIRFKPVSKQDRLTQIVVFYFVCGGFIYGFIALANRIFKRSLAVESKWAFFVVILLVILRMMIAGRPDSAMSPAEHLGVGFWPLLFFGLIYYRVKQVAKRKFS